MDWLFWMQGTAFSNPSDLSTQRLPYREERSAMARDSAPVCPTAEIVRAILVTVVFLVGVYSCKQSKMGPIGFFLLSALLDYRLFLDAPGSGSWDGSLSWR